MPTNDSKHYCKVPPPPHSSLLVHCQESQNKIQQVDPVQVVQGTIKLFNKE
jgi:hypothetical protein